MALLCSKFTVGISERLLFFIDSEKFVMERAPAENDDGCEYKRGPA